MNVPDRIHLTGLSVPCIIGLYDRERKRKQKVVLDLSFPCDAAKAASRDRVEDAVDYKRVAKAAQAFVAKSRYLLVETLAENLAAHLLGLGMESVTLCVSKPGAIRHAQNVSITLTRRKNPIRAHFSLGSNEEPGRHLAAALQTFEKEFGELCVSSWYETSPVGGPSKRPFWNLVVGVDTDRRPGDLRRWALRLERLEGRLRTADKDAPRTLDVDLLDWGGKVGPARPRGCHPLPHPDIPSKAYVLFPFLEIAPRWVHPGTNQSLVEIAAAFRDPSQKIRRVTKPGF
jgi:2-amino-4-hydroxy-6-hydroxymethyldihydropteridine diphosphokinase